VKDEKEAEEVAQEMVKLGFSNQKNGYKVLMPKDQKIAKRVGYIITTGINYGLRQTNQERDLRYWTYHQDKDHYAIVLISSKVFEELGF
jgi:thymidine phosphorylase